MREVPEVSKVEEQRRRNALEELDVERGWTREKPEVVPESVRSILREVSVF